MFPVHVPGGLGFWWDSPGEVALCHRVGAMEEEKVSKLCRRYGGYGGSDFLEDGGPKEWRSMEEFCKYLRKWQARTNVDLVYWDSKRCRAYNSSNKFAKDNPSYVPESLSKFAYKAWVCSLGRRGVKENPCRFMVRAKYLPVERKIVCRVLRHIGPGALPNGHNHQVETSESADRRVCPVGGFVGDKNRGRSIEGGEDEGEVVLSSWKGHKADVESVLKKMVVDPEGAGSLVDGMSMAKRRKVCELSFLRSAKIISRPEVCSGRQMIEALNLVELLAQSIRRRAQTRGSIMPEEAAQVHHKEERSDHVSASPLPPRRGLDPYHLG